MNEAETLLCPVILSMYGMLDSHQRMEPPKDWYEKVEPIKAVVVFAMKSLNTTQA